MDNKHVASVHFRFREVMAAVGTVHALMQGEQPSTHEHGGCLVYVFQTQPGAYHGTNTATIHCAVIHLYIPPSQIPHTKYSAVFVSLQFPS